MAGAVQVGKTEKTEYHTFTVQWPECQEAGFGSDRRRIHNPLNLDGTEVRIPHAQLGHLAVKLICDSGRIRRILADTHIVGGGGWAGGAGPAKSRFLGSVHVQLSTG